MRKIQNSQQCISYTLYNLFFENFIIYGAVQNEYQHLFTNLAL